MPPNDAHELSDERIALVPVRVAPGDAPWRRRAVEQVRIAGDPDIARELGQLVGRYGRLEEVVGKLCATLARSAGVAKDAAGTDREHMRAALEVLADAFVDVRRGAIAALEELDRE